MIFLYIYISYQPTNQTMSAINQPFLNQLNEIFDSMNEEYPIDNELEIRIILSLIQRHNQALEYDCSF